MRFSGIILGVVLLVFYIAVFIPFILPNLMTIFNDWINNSGDMFNQRLCVVREFITSAPTTVTSTITTTTEVPVVSDTSTVSTTTMTTTTTTEIPTTTSVLTTQPECTQQDFRPLVVFLFQLVVYFIVPVSLIIYSFIRK
jgi:hypothetical protein